MPMVELQRLSETTDEDEVSTPERLLVNPAFVSAVFASVDPGVTIVRGPDGRGYKVRGSFEAVRDQLGFAPGSDTARDLN
jgi:hypothetical protein